MNTDTNVPDFGYWFQNVVSAAFLVVSPDALARTWIQRERITSWYDVDEMLEQLLGDLHLQEDTERFKTELKQIRAYEAVKGFANAIVDLEALVKRDARFEEPETLLGSERWMTIRAAADGVVKLAAARKFAQ